MTKFAKFLSLVVAVALAGCSAQSPGTSQSPSVPQSGTPLEAPTATAVPSADSLIKPEPTWEWQIKSEANETELAGYTDKVSVPEGESFGLYVTSDYGDVKMTAYRVGDYGGKGAGRVWVAEKFKAPKQPKPQIDGNRTVVAKWKKTLDVETKGWPAGAYLLKMTSGGKDKFVPMMIRSTDLKGKLVIQSAITTFQAYNKWGGYSLYLGKSGFGDRAYKVSFDRPYDGYAGAGQFFSHEMRPIQYIESLGLDLAYTTSLEVHRDPNLLDGAAGFVSLGHDEYWTVEMRNHVEAARDAGVNIVFLGANALYWRVRFEQGMLGADRLMVGYKSAATDPLKNKPESTDLWRRNPHPRPENSLTGMLYECFPAEGALVVETPDFFGFAGTGVKKGSKIPQVLRVEVDRAYPIKGTPKSLQVVSHSPFQCGKNKTFSDMVYYTTEAGAGVFTTGNMNWTKLMVDSPAKEEKEASTFIKKVTANVLKEAAVPFLGKRHPAKPNLGSLGVSSSTANGTGGAVGG